MNPQPNDAPIVIGDHQQPSWSKSDSNTTQSNAASHQQIQLNPSQPTLDSQSHQQPQPQTPYNPNFHGSLPQPYPYSLSGYNSGGPDQWYAAGPPMPHSAPPPFFQDSMSVFPGPVPQGAGPGFPGPTFRSGPMPVVIPANSLITPVFSNYPRMGPPMPHQPGYMMMPPPQLGPPMQPRPHPRHNSAPHIPTGPAGPMTPSLISPRGGRGSFGGNKPKNRGFSNRSDAERRRNQPEISGPSKTGPASASRTTTRTTTTIVSKAQSTYVIGPPLKPRQSGYAVWIGNLPLKVELVDVVNHVCNLTPGLESLFLISKSNCAFANFSDEESWNLALQCLHDTTLGENRLVARQRKIVSDAPVIPLEMDSSPFSRMESSSASIIKSRWVHKERFFVLKSLTVEDLKLSVKTGVWATQSHNEEALNDAFKHADVVYLLFSANKSGSYFGYARMTSPLNSDPEAAIKFGPLSTAAVESGSLQAMEKPAHGKVPAGRIFSDTLRGTIFWEIERDEPPIASPADQGGVDESEKPMGKPFTLEWLSTSPVPFSQAKGIINPWNSNREVKIARDGTEIEPEAGRKLLQLFTVDSKHQKQD